MQNSTKPLTVYQFSPLDFIKGTMPSYSADASLLMPTNAWGQSFVVPSAEVGGRD